ncbi:thiol-disulfide oxidoreductase ResA [mine drainage metagenome]|uniref:thioredoxin-dependent peroxiredoxin n=1 Tax=mine drainage metagenome TaxID=410659 RepID=A0A1J5RZI7_9ZZZZ
MKLQIFITALIIAPIFSIAQISAKGLQINDKAPLFAATDQNGKKISLKDELKKGTAVLVFYRGQWCPYCNRQLKKLEDSLSFIKSKGATLIAITPEKPENITKTIEKTKASYSVLFDDGLKIMKSYDVAFTVDDNTLKNYKKWGIDLAEANGNNGNVLPVPAVYIINKNGIITYKHFDPDYKQRASVQEILMHL